MPRQAALIFLLLVSVCGATSESFKGDGYFSGWHDGAISDRASATGQIEYGAESYEGGFSSGLNVTGTGAYSFIAPDYMVSLQKFNGSILAESDAKGTTVDGFGTGKLETRSYGLGGDITGFPIGGMNSNGVFDIHVNGQPEASDQTMNISEDAEFLRNLI